MVAAEQIILANKLGLRCLKELQQAAILYSQSIVKF